MMYTADGQQITPEEVKQIQQQNRVLLDKAIASGDLSPLLSVQWLFGEEIEKASREGKT